MFYHKREMMIIEIKLPELYLHAVIVFLDSIHFIAEVLSQVYHICSKPSKLIKQIYYILRKLIIKEMISTHPFFLIHTPRLFCTLNLIKRRRIK